MVFDSLDDISDEGLAVDISAKLLLEANFCSETDPEFWQDNGFGKLISWQGNGFLNDASVTCPAFLSSSMQLEAVREHLLAYENMALPYVAPEIKCRYVYEWSVAAKTDASRFAAFRLLSWMMSTSYQEALMITECSEGPLPINRECFFTKTQMIGMPVLQEIYPAFTFGRWQYEE